MQLATEKRRVKRQEMFSWLGGVRFVCLIGGFRPIKDGKVDLRETMLFPRLTLPLADAVRYAKPMRRLGAWVGLARGLAARTEANRGEQLARALGFAGEGRLRRQIVEALRRRPGVENAEVWSQVVVRNPRYAEVIRQSPRLSRSIVLKGPGTDGEKGVLLMTFEYNWARLLLGLTDEEMGWLDEHYDLVLSTSWSPTDYAVLALALARTRSRLFVQSCNYSEIPSIEAFHPRLKCLETLPCDWINPGLYEPKAAAERTTDIVMVANWGEFKRHWELFRALSRMPKELKVVLIGQPEPGRSKEFIRRLARQFGARQEIEILESLPIAEVARHQGRAKVSVILTRREGCCVAAVESLFAGCALAMREDAHVGPLAYINGETGRKLRTGRIHEDLMMLLQSAEDLQPARWAREHLANERSYAKLNALLRAEAVGAERPWTRDLVLPQWRPHPTFAREDEKEALRPVYEDLNRKFPQVFSPTLIDDSWR